MMPHPSSLVGAGHDRPIDPSLPSHRRLWPTQRGPFANGPMPAEMPPLPRRAGFTLLEVMVAIVLTSIVVAIAYAMAQAGLDARTRLTSRLRATQSAHAAREILRDALRNARTAQSTGDPRGGVLLSNDTLSFVAAGGAAPLDPDYDWRFTIAPGRGGLTVAARALGHTQPATVTFKMPDVTRWTVWMLAPDGHTWRTDWTEPVLMPRAVVIGFWNGNHLSGLPLHISLWPGASPTLADSLPGLSSAGGRVQ